MNPPVDAPVEAEKKPNPYAEHLKYVTLSNGEVLPFLKDLWTFFNQMSGRFE
jgi:hypothetical protein